MRGAWLSIAFLAGLCVTSNADSLTYQNSRFGTRISFPAEIFDIIDPAPTNGDGRLFRSPDGAELAVFASFNVQKSTPGGMLSSMSDKAAAKGREITYASSGNNWVVVSGYADQTVFYERYEFGANDTIHAMVLRYPETQKHVYDELVGPIAGSLEGP